MLADHGARVDMDCNRVYFTLDIIDKSLEAAPDSFTLYDSLGNEAVDLSASNGFFTIMGVNIIGGCCGTTPEHIAAIRKVVDEYICN